jgi:hypothetical protein
MLRIEGTLSQRTTAGHVTPMCGGFTSLQLVLPAASAKGTDERQAINTWAPKYEAGFSK